MPDVYLDSISNQGKNKVAEMLVSSWNKVQLSVKSEEWENENKTLVQCLHSE